MVLRGIEIFGKDLWFLLISDVKANYAKFNLLFICELCDLKVPKVQFVAENYKCVYVLCKFRLFII